MKTIAVTFWNGLISPLFDAAATVLIIGPDKEQQQEQLGNGPLHTKVNTLEKHGVTVLICGAISAEARNALQERNIRVIPWISGSVEEVLKAFENNTLESGPFFMPGCGRRNRCRNRHNRHIRQVKGAFPQPFPVNRNGRAGNA